MLHTKLALGLLTLALAAPFSHAQSAAPESAKSAVSAVNPESIQALKDMGAHLQTLKRFSVSTDLTGERVLADGQKLQHSATAKIEGRASQHAARENGQPPGSPRNLL